MNRTSFFSQFLSFPIFTKQTLFNAAKRMAMSKNTLNSYIKRAIEKKELIVLKRGVYVTHHFLSAQKAKLDYVFYISSKLLGPSYISRETALQYYGLLTEANNTVITCTSISTTRRFSNRLGVFDYKTMKSSLFIGYNNIREDFDFYIAEPYKAIFDYLYFRIPRKDLRNKDAVLSYLDEFRIDYDSIDRSELNKLFTLTATL